MQTALIIGGTSYTNVTRAGARIHLDSLHRDLMGGYDELAFSVHGGAPTPSWTKGTAVSLTVDYGGGAGAQVKFKGEVTDLSWGTGPHGWIQGYNCQGLKYQSDRIPITAPDLTGNYILNRTPEDPYYIPADAGLTIGAIFTRVLTIQDTANALSAIGIQYASLSPPALAAATVVDFALLDIVPPQPVNLSGESLFNTLDQILSRWMPKYVIEVQPDGTIRAKDTTDPAVFVPRTLTLAGPTGPGDAGVAWPSIRSSTARCATRLILRGGSIAGVCLLSLADGTLKPAWTQANQDAWKLTDFTQPGNSKNSGTIVSITGNSATVQSNDATATWAANFWSGLESYLYLTNPAATGIAITEFRQITANSALTAGGTCTITWDASQPLDSTGYSQYRIVGGALPINDVGRLFDVCEPASGNLALNTFVGAHLLVRSPLPLTWANNTKSVQVYYATAIVVGGSLKLETPVGVEALPATGQFRLVIPDVLPNGSISTLNSGWPTTVADGLPTDVQILAIYSRGALEAVVPPDVGGVPQYEGTAYSVDGLQVTKYIDVAAFVNQWSQTSMVDLAQQHLDAIKDTVYEGTGDFYGEPDWDFLDFNYALNYAIDGATSPWSDINAPVRTVTVAWPQAVGYQHRVSFGFSTQRRPFSGDDLYLHPSFTGNSVIGQLQGDMGGAAFATAYAGSPLAGYGGGMEGGAGGMAPQMDLDSGPVGRPATSSERRIRGEREENRQKHEAERRERAERGRAAARQKELDRQAAEPRAKHDAKMAELSAQFGPDPGTYHEPIVMEDPFDRPRDADAPGFGGDGPLDGGG